MQNMERAGRSQIRGIKDKAVTYTRGHLSKAPAMASGEIKAPGDGQTQRMPCRSTHGSAVALVRPDMVLLPITCRYADIMLHARISALLLDYAQFEPHMHSPCFPRPPAHKQGMLATAGPLATL